MRYSVLTTKAKSSVMSDADKGAKQSRCNISLHCICGCKLEFVCGAAPLSSVVKWVTTTVTLRGREIANQWVTPNVRH